MSAATVDQILRQIEQLPEEDRLLLEKRLAELAEAKGRGQLADAYILPKKKLKKLVAKHKPPPGWYKERDKPF